MDRPAQTAVLRMKGCRFGGTVLVRTFLMSAMVHLGKFSPAHSASSCSVAPYASSTCFAALSESLARTRSREAA